VYSYLAYGLGIQSALSLPELMPGEAGADVIVRLEDDPPPWEPPDDAQWCLKIVSDEEITLCGKGFALFQVREGKEIAITSAPGVDERLVQLFTVGTVLPIALRQRGRHVLHGSCVEINGNAVAFLGQSGAGKSSIAAALHARGHPLIADDVTAIEFDAGRALVYSAFPQVKLSGAVAAALGCAGDQLIDLHPMETRRGYRVPEPALGGPYPLRQIYVLARDAHPRIEALRPAGAMMELSRHSSFTAVARFYNAGPGFHACASLANHVSVSRLWRSDSLDLLPRLAQMVEDHAGSQGAPQRCAALTNEDRATG